MSTCKIEWIAVDWGTSNLRAWPIDENGTARAELASDKGMGRLSPEQFEDALLDLIADWLGDEVTPVVCCGMVGAAQGWKEAPYAALPCPAPGIGQAIKVPTQDPRLSVHILPGVKQPKPADVMRGEETQIAGYLADNPDFDGVICLPGTHTKWVSVQNRIIQEFRTFMTGELFALLETGSILRHSLAREGWNEEAFLAGVAEGATTPDRISAQLFSIRAATLVDGTQPEVARARLSGLLLGVELAGSRDLWLNRQVVLIGSQRLCDHYIQALALQETDAHVTDGSELTLKGLQLAYQSLKEHTS